MRLRATAALLGGALLALGACTAAPSAEVRLFRDSVAAIDQAGQPLLDDLALAERSAYRTSLREKAQANSAAEARGRAPTGEERWVGRPLGAGFVRDLRVEDAPFEASIGDPPGTAALRAGLGTVTALSAALVGLTDGTNAGAAADDLVRSVAALSDLVAAGGALVGTPLATGGLKAAIEELRGLARRLADELNARRARELILENERQVDALLAGLREAVPAMWTVLTSDLQIAIMANPRMAETELRPAVARAEAYRRLLSDYAVLIARAQEAWRGAVTAARTPGSLTLAAVAENATRLRADLEAIRRAQAALRSGQLSP
jgi:hypothetical protein